MPLSDTGQAQTLDNTQGVIEGQRGKKGSSSYPMGTNTVGGLSVCVPVPHWERSVGETIGKGESHGSRIMTQQRNKARTENHMD
jgi:hypothetical protein